MSLAPLTTKETKAPPAGRATSPFAPKLALSAQRTALDASARTSPASTFRAGARLQRKPSGSSPTSVAPPIVHDTLRSSGQPLDPGTQTFFEQRFRHDFSQVRIHNDSQAHASAEAVGARAYTVGPRIVFGPGGPNRRLLGHELTHVVQQQGAAAAPASPLGSSLPVWDDPASEREADRAATQTESGGLAGPVNAGGRAALQRDADPSEGFGWFEDKLLSVALDPLGLSGALLDMVGASIKGFYVTMRDEGPAHAAQAWDRVKDAFHHPSQLGHMVLNYWWGLIKGIFSPITGLVSLAGLVIKLPFLEAQILTTAWRKREELAGDLRRMYARGQQLGSTAREVVSNAMHNPLETAKALAGWFSSLGGKATSSATDAGRGAAHLLLGEVSKPLPELGGDMGEFLGTALVNVVLFFFTAGVGDAIVQLAARIGELGAWLGEAGEIGGMLGGVAAKVETLLFTVGGWITKVEQGLAAATETIFKPLGKLMSGFGDFLGDLRGFFRELFEASEEGLALEGKAAGNAAEKLGTGAAPTAAPKPLPDPVPHATAPAATPHTTPATTPHTAPAAKPNVAAQANKDADVIDMAAAREKRAAAAKARARQGTVRQKVAVGDNTTRAAWTDTDEDFADHIASETQGKAHPDDLVTPDVDRENIRKDKHIRPGETDLWQGDSALLAKRLGPPPGDGLGYQAHHIVPSGEPRAAALRDFMEKHGWRDINDVDNGVWLQTHNKFGNVEAGYKHEFTFDNPAFQDEYFKRLEDILMKDPKIGPAGLRLKLRGIRSSLLEGKLP